MTGFEGGTCFGDEAKNFLLVEVVLVLRFEHLKMEKSVPKMTGNQFECLS